MARCNFCGAETQLYDSGQPICVPCSDKQYEAIRARELEALEKRRSQMAGPDAHKAADKAPATERRPRLPGAYPSEK